MEDPEPLAQRLSLKQINGGSACRAMVNGTSRSTGLALLLSCANPEGPRKGEHMRFPEMSRKGDPSHTSAGARLAAARGEERRLAADAHAAKGSSNEHEAASRLSAATAEVAAREAWLSWVERGV